MRIQCPICKKVLVDAPEDFGPRPFCSMHCKTIDLGNWLGEVYRIPVSPRDEGFGRPSTDDSDEHTLS